MKNIVSFLRRYYLFSIAVFTAIIGLLLRISHQKNASNWLIAIVSIIEVLPLLWSMVQDIRSGKYGIDILAATAIVASVLLHQEWAALVVVLMLTGGESLEDYAEERAHGELNALLIRAPQTAHLIRNRKVVDVKVNELKKGDKFIIKPGELVAVDGLIIEGSTSFDESSLTGESTPQTKNIGDIILSGSINNDSVVTVKATADSANSQYQQIINLVRSASSSQAPFVRLADRYSIPFTFMAYAIASAVWVISGQPIRFLEVIIVATPCPLLLAAPIALISGMSRASKYGIIVKTGSALERLAETATFAFDKTGTLTQGKPQVEDVMVWGNHTTNEIVSLAAGLEQASNHIVAAAIIENTNSRNIKALKVKHVEELPGQGLKAIIAGKVILVGKLSLLQEQSITMPIGFNDIRISQTVVYVAIDGELGGAIILDDKIRTNTKATLQRLQKLGAKDIIMITGDNKRSAVKIAKQLEILTVHSEAMPADKLHYLEAITNRPVAFIGDGVNDAPVLTVSDIGIALGARGSTAASESADMVIMQDDISKVATAYEIAKRTFQIARQSILVGIGLSLVLMIFFSTGKFPPLLGAVLQEIVDVVVIFNALRAHHITIQS